MLREAEGNLLDADTDALVNAVNTVGVMGKGIALQFNQARTSAVPGAPAPLRPVP